jgi:hypothetical protein
MGLMGMAWSAVIGFATLDQETARRVELRIQGQTVAESAGQPGQGGQ